MFVALISSPYCRRRGIMGLERFSGISDITLFPSMILMALAGIGVALLTVWCARRFEVWWDRTRR